MQVEAMEFTDLIKARYQAKLILEGQKARLQRIENCLEVQHKERWGFVRTFIQA